jgi:hypothetical protein
MLTQTIEHAVIFAGASEVWSKARHVKASTMGCTNNKDTAAQLCAPRATTLCLMLLEFWLKNCTVNVQDLWLLKDNITHHQLPFLKHYFLRTSTPQRRVVKSQDPESKLALQIGVMLDIDVNDDYLCCR